MENQANGGRVLITPSSITTPPAELTQQNLHESTSFGKIHDQALFLFRLFLKNGQMMFPD